ncbi:SDR family NAD(P)-dependent oxidoreductase [Singulisphaera rosea]
MATQDKVAFITGANKGIGLETARGLGALGITVVIGSRDEANGRAAAETLKGEGIKNVEAVRFDVTKPEDHQAIAKDLEERYGKLDILVNNAGILRDRSIAKMSVEAWQDVIDVNLTGVFLGCKFGLEIMRDGGSIINMGSLSAEAGFHGQSNYAAAKAGVHGLTRVLSRECARRSIRVNAVAPGIIETAMTSQLPEDVKDGMRKNIPSRQFGKPQDVANAVLFLASPLAGYVNGHVLEVDGGWNG